jgi:predicted DNA-binding transcriptional regulator AlpA
MATNLPQSGFARLTSIIGDPKADPPIPALIPVSKSSWYAGIAKGIYPAPVRISANTVAWRWSDLNKLVEHLEQAAA